MPRHSQQKKAAQLRVQSEQAHQEASVSQDLPTQLEAAHARINVLQSQLENQSKINERLASELEGSQSLASRSEEGGR
jgi:predicted RNase H-like nuclease (RuvC/YqgF family)